MTLTYFCFRSSMDVPVLKLMRKSRGRFVEGLGWLGEPIKALALAVCHFELTLSLLHDGSFH